MLFLSFVVAVAGGVTRDLLIGAVPPAAIADWYAFALAMAGGLVTFLGDVRGTPAQVWIGGWATGSNVSVSNFALDLPPRR